MATIGAANVSVIAVNGTTGTGTASITPALPSGTVVGDRVFVIRGHTHVNGTIPSGWTSVISDQVIGSGTVASGSGRRYESIYYRDYDGIWTMPAWVLTNSSNTSHAGAALAVRPTPGGVLGTPVAVGGGNDYGTANNTLTVSLSMTAAIPVDGWIIGGLVSNDLVTLADSGAMNSMSSGAFAGGVGNYTKSTAGTNVGFDVSCMVFAGKATTATSSTWTATMNTFSATFSASTQSGIYFLYQPITVSPTDIQYVSSASYASGSVAASTVPMTPPLPTGTVSGDRVYVHQSGTTTSASTPAGWTVLGTKDDIVGSGAVSAAAGARRATWYYRDYDGIWSMPAFALTSAANNDHILDVFGVRAASGSVLDTPTITTIGHSYNAATIPVTDTSAAAFTTHGGGGAILLAGGTYNSGGFWSGVTLTQSGAAFLNTSFVTSEFSAQGNAVYSLGLAATVATGATATLTLSAAPAFSTSQGEVLFLEQTQTQPTTGSFASSALKSTMSAAGTWVDASADGTLAATTLKATASLAGSQEQTGTLTASALKSTMSSVGTTVENPTGTLAASALKPTMAATGAQAQTGALAASALKAQMGAAGTTVENPTGALAASALKSTASLTGSQAQSGALAASALKAQMAASGVQFDMPIGTLASTAPKATMAASGEQITLGATLVDPFATGSVPDAKWNYSNVTVSGGTARFVNGVMSTVDHYDLTDSPVMAQLVDIGPAGGGTNNAQFLAWTPDYGGQAIGIYITGGNLFAYSTTYGGFVTISPYDPAVHKWFRITGLTGGVNIAIEYATDPSGTWTSIYTGTGGGHLLNRVQIGMSGTSPGAETVQWDNVNVLPTSGILGASALKPTMSASGSQAQTGALSATALKAVASLTGAQTLSGALAATALKAQAALSGAQTQVGLLAASALKSVASLAGSHVENPTGILSASALKATASLTAAQQYLATLTASALKSLMSFAGDSTSPPGVLSGSAQLSTASMTGEMPASGILSALSLKATAALTGTQEQSGALASSALKAVASFNAQQIFTGILSGAALKSTAALTGLEEYVATLSASAQKALASLTGEQPTSGILAAASVKAIMASAGTALQTGALTMTALKSTAAFTAVQEYAGTLTASAKKAVASFNAAQSQSGILGASALKAVASLTATLTNSGTLHAVARKAIAALTGTSTVDTSLPRFAVVGKLKTIGVGMAESALRSAIITFKPNIPPEVLARYLEKMFRVRPVVAHLDSDGDIVNADGGTVRLLAEHSSLNLEGLQWQVSVRVPSSVIPPMPEQKFRSWWIDAGFNGDTIDVMDAVPEHDVHGVHYR